jgi:periplasmic divalent cation tolerance protein
MVYCGGGRAWRLAQVQENDKPVLIYSTFPSQETAEAAGRALVERRLAACVNILPGMTSIYRWEGAIAREAEVVMMIKTRQSLSAEVMAVVKQLHPYSNPALVVLPVLDGAPDYIRWLLDETVRASADGVE